MMLPSGLCVGLDPDVTLFPEPLRETRHIASFLRQIIEATSHVAKAYKINTAFFEQYGAEGVAMLYQVRDAVGDRFCILDAKRADIGNTSAAYARFLFDTLQASAVTVAPYMGYDSVAPFLDRGFSYLLALTSNPGSANFQRMVVNTPQGPTPLYKHVIRTAISWKGANNVGFVVGATHPEELAEIRHEWPAIPLLIPGLGTQGAGTTETSHANNHGPALFNVGRSILYASSASDYVQAAAEQAENFANALSQ